MEIYDDETRHGDKCPLNGHICCTVKDDLIFMELGVVGACV